MTDLDLLCSYLGIEGHQGKSQITLSQRPYSAHIFESFQMVECNPIKTPMESQLKLKKKGGGDVEDKKSTSGHVFFLGGQPITCNSLKQRVVALSSCEAEYREITSAICQGVWIAK